MNPVFKPTRTAALISVALAAGLSAFAAGATDKVTDKPMADKPMADKPMDSRATPNSHSDRAHMKAYSGDREALQAQLKPGLDAAAYRSKLTELGYQVTAVNDREADYVEYEIVKGGNSHEVQIDFDKATKKATKVDVAMNMWRADATKAALRGQKYTTATTADYSDRAYRKEWSNEKDSLEKALGTGHDKAYYAKKLKELGYKVTATNDKEADYLEYEVVKGNRTYEVQVDFDKTSKKSSKVDVAANLWNAEATDKAVAANRPDKTIKK
jgi:uncharacterized protein YmfQ (DUF2313 family)